MSNFHGLIPASSIHSNDGIYITDYLETILAIINEDIRIASESRQTSCITEIPTNFELPGMSIFRAQKHIYYHILKTLESACYFPHIEFRGDKNMPNVFVYVSWYSVKEQDAELHMHNYIKRHTKRTRLEPIKPGQYVKKNR